VDGAVARAEAADLCPLRAEHPRLAPEEQTDEVGPETETVAAVAMSRGRPSPSAASVTAVVGAEENQHDAPADAALLVLRADLEVEAEARAAAEAAVAQVQATAMADTRAAAEALSALAARAADAARLSAEVSLDQCRFELAARDGELESARRMLDSRSDELVTVRRELEHSSQRLSSVERELVESRCAAPSTASLPPTPPTSTGPAAASCPHAPIPSEEEGCDGTGFSAASEAHRAAVAAAVHAAVSHTQAAAFANQCSAVEEAMAHAREAALAEAGFDAADLAEARAEIDSLRSNLLAEIDAHAATRAEAADLRAAELESRRRAPAPEAAGGPLPVEEVELVAAMAAEAAVAAHKRACLIRPTAGADDVNLMLVSARMEGQEAILRSVEAAIVAGARDVAAVRCRTDQHAAALDAMRTRLAVVEASAANSRPVAGWPPAAAATHSLVHDALTTLAAQQSALAAEVRGCERRLGRVEARADGAQAAAGEPRDIAGRLCALGLHVEEQRRCLEQLAADTASLAAAHGGHAA
jgi:hypothetical protein